MSRVSTILRRLAIPSVALLLALVWSTTAQAGEKTALERLTDFERAQLATQVEGWDQLPPPRREEIAGKIIWYRELPEDQRRALLERIERLKRSRASRRGPRPDRLKHHLDPQRMKSHRQRGQLTKAVGAVLWGALPEPTRESIDQTLGAKGRERVAMAFVRRLVGRIAARRVEEGIPPIELSPDVPEEWRRRIEGLRAKAEADDAHAREMLAHMSVFNELQRAVKDLELDGAFDEADVRRLGAAVKERYPEAVTESVAQLVKAAEKPETLQRYAPPHRGPGDRHGGSPEAQARRLLHTLEQSSELLRQHPELAEPARELRRMLRRMVGDRPPRDGMGPGRRPGGGDRRSGSPGGRRGSRRGGPRDKVGPQDENQDEPRDN